MATRMSSLDSKIVTMKLILLLLLQLILLVISREVRGNGILGHGPRGGHDLKT